MVGCISASAVEPIVTLWTWSPGPDYPTYILPGRASEGRVDVLSAYIRKMRASPSLKTEIPLTKWNGLHFDPAARPKGFLWHQDSRRRVLLLANGLQDHVPSTPRLNMFIPRFQSLGLKSFVLPVGATARFSRQERQAIHKLLGQHFGTINPLGGPDIAPEHYGQDVKYAVNFNSERDAYEIELLQDVYNLTKAKITGPCRAMQIVCVALGCALNQDIQKVLNINEVHSAADHGIEHPVVLFPTSNGLADALFSGLESWFISYHHQSVSLPPQSIFEIAAVSHQGVIEAVISRDGRIVLTQGHAERPDSAGAGEIFYRRLAMWMKSSSDCNSILGAAI